MIRRIRSSRAVPFAGLAAGVALLLAGCGGGGSTPETTDTPTATNDPTEEPEGPLTDTRELYVYAGSMPPIVANFNPFSPTVLHAALGLIYETLFYYNQAGPGDPVPVLGESFEWNDAGDELTVKIKEGVLWSDGAPLTAEDVAFTFTYEANQRSYIKDAVVVDDHTIRIELDGPQVANEFALLGSTWILPKAHWEDKEDPINDPNEQPIGSGPYVVDSLSESQYTVVRNDNYRDRDQVAVPEIVYLAVDGNEAAMNMMIAGELDYIGIFQPDPEIFLSTGFIDGINTPQDPTVLYTCSNADLGCEGFQTDVAVRQALSLALDRGEINEKAFGGNGAVISPTFALLGRDDDWIADGMPGAIEQTADPEAAKAILEDAGYVLGSDGIFTKDGQRLELTITSVDGWTDYNDAARLMEEYAREAGIHLTASTISWNEFADNRASGNYELIMGGVIGASIADPYQVYRDWFTTEYTNPVGEALDPGNWNISRYSNPIVDQAVADAAVTADVDAKKAAYAKVQEEIVRDLPYIPVLVNATQTWWNNQDFTGWPSEDNLYAFPPPWRAGAVAQVVTKIRAAD